MPRKVNRNGIYKNYKHENKNENEESYSICNTIINYIYETFSLIKNIFFNSFS